MIPKKLPFLDKGLLDVRNPRGRVLFLVLSFLLFYGLMVSFFSMVSSSDSAKWFFFSWFPSTSNGSRVPGSLENNLTAYNQMAPKANKGTITFSSGIHDDGLKNATSRHGEGNATGLLPGNSSDDQEEQRSFKECDIFDGRWVRDKREPFYPPGSCPYVDPIFNCHVNGRPDYDFLHWRWQPNHCNIPRMNATDFLRRLRGKRLVFVGDSLNRNMWESLVCTLRNSVANKERVFEISGGSEFKARPYSSFKFADYNCSVEYARAPFLVKQSYVKLSKKRKSPRLRLDLMETTAAKSRNAEIIVFNTARWWGHDKTGKNFFQVGKYVYPYLPRLEAYEKGLGTWANWIDQNIDRERTQVFFRGLSDSHFRGGRWNSGGKCHNETEPIYKEEYLERYHPMMLVVERIMKKMETSATFLNISRLTSYRKDGHPSIYRKKIEGVKEQIAAMEAQDCSHWCLPGIPDVWNELLYASLLQAGRGSWKF